MITFEIGILDTHTGKQIKKSILSEKPISSEDYGTIQEQATRAAKKIASWFDTKNTFFDARKIWDVWKRIGTTLAIENLINGKSLTGVVKRDVIVFSGKTPTTYQFYIIRKEDRR